MAKSATRWLPLFRKYISQLRIQSKHAASDPDGTGIPLKMWTSQTRVLEQICEGIEQGIHVFYILKSRQLGVTTITLAILIFWAALHPNTICCQVSDSDKTSAKNRETIRSYLRSLAAFMGKSFAVTKDNKFGFTFSNGSRIDLLVAGKSKVNWGEGEGYLAALLTEVSSYGKEEGLESFYHAMAPENPRSLYIYESTAHGNNHWKRMWEDARKDAFSSGCIFVGWWSHGLQRIGMTDKRWPTFGTAPPSPEENDRIIAVRDQYGYVITMEQLAWYRWNRSRPNASEEDADQNQPWIETDAFIQTGTSFFHNKLIYDRREAITGAEPAYVKDGGYAYNGYSFYLGDEYHLSKVERIYDDVDPDYVKMRVWEEPVPEGWYIIGVDPAGGRSELSNNHSINVWRAFGDKLVQVAEWADNIPDTRHCAWVCAYLAGWYQNCRINIDLTGGVGTAVMQAFDDLRARLRSELYQGKTGTPEDFCATASWYLYRRPDAPSPGYMYNTKMGRDLKWRMMNMLRDSWTTNLIEVRSVPLLDEMINVRQTNLDIGASAPGRERDDRTFAMGLANMTWLENIRPGLISQGITWDGSMQKESGALSPAADLLNRRVFSIMRRAEEMADLPPPKTFFDLRGLV